MFLREYWESEEEERKKWMEQYDPRKLLEGRFTIPFIKDFFDVVDDEPGTIALLASNRHKVTFSLSDAPCKKAAQSMDEWIRQTAAVMEKKNLHMKVEYKKVIGNMEYFCYMMPTAEGSLYNIMFRMQKEERIYAGALNCLKEEKEGMGLLLEAMVHVMEEMNRQEAAV